MEDFDDLLQEEEELLSVPEVKKSPPIKTNLGDLLKGWKKKQEKENASRD